MAIDIWDAFGLLTKPKLQIYKLFDEAHLPAYATDWSACFDLRASIRVGDEVTVMDFNDVKRKVVYQNGISLSFGERALIPTGLIFDLNEEQSMRIHPRSGLAWKNGITLANAEGVIDADYIQQTFVMLLQTSDSSEPFVIHDGDRIAQGEIVINEQVIFTVTDTLPEVKTDRVGGFGSTGV
jgi:dUTP pyrophosphatase|tara:strand:- start:348 stop:893 length:546 start_codon:yes stop_codon:yes gene_type:complete